MTPPPAAPPEPLTNYLPPVAGASAGETERWLAVAWASITARRDPAANLRRVLVLRPLAFGMSN